MILPQFSCTFFWRILLSHCPNFAELELSKEVKSYHENPCNRITGKKSSPRSFRMPLCNLERKQKRPLTGEISPHKRSSQRAMPVEKERPHPRGVSPSTGYVPHYKNLILFRWSLVSFSGIGLSGFLIALIRLLAIAFLQESQ